MSSSSSIIQEYYKVQDYWKEVSQKTEYKLFIWRLEYQDVEIVNTFLAIERSPAGSFEDIFFQLNTRYTGDDTEFEKGLWNEFRDWFSIDDPRIDLFGAMRKDGILNEDYQPDFSVEPTAGNLWKELLRLKNAMQGYEEKYFCLYIPPVLPDSPKLTDWFLTVLDGGIPDGIRLVTIDYREKSLLKIRNSKKAIIIEPNLDMQNAINNDINRQFDAKNTVSPEDRFRKQIKHILDLSAKKEKASLKKEAAILISLSEDINKTPAILSALLVASQAYFFVQEDDKAEEYIDKAINKADEELDADSQEIYALWKSIILFKGSIVLKKRKHRSALVIYERLTDEATKRKDVYYIMEGHRLCGHLYYELGETNKAFEMCLLSLYAGSFLELSMRRQSTYLQSAYLAVFLGEKSQGPNEMQILYEQLKEWIGDDWQSLIKTREMKHSTVRSKAPLIERLK